MNLPKYVLITPARNEAQFIELTLKSVVAQTVRPLKWIIVSDGSTDGTDEIVKHYAAVNPWIELLRMPSGETGTSPESACVQCRLCSRKGLNFDVVGSLDADLSFDAELFSFLLGN